MSGLLEADRFIEKWSPNGFQFDRYSIEFELYLAMYVDSGGSFEEKFVGFSRDCKRLAKAFVYGASGYSGNAIEEFNSLADDANAAEVRTFAKIHSLIGSGEVTQKEFKPFAKAYRKARDWEDRRIRVVRDIEEDLMTRASPVERNLLDMLTGIIYLHSREWAESSNCFARVIVEHHSDFLVGRASALQCIYMASADIDWLFEQTIADAQRLLFPQLDSERKTLYLLSDATQFPKVDNARENELDLVADMRNDALPTQQFTTASSIGDELARVEAESKKLAKRTAELKEQHRLAELGELAAAIFGEDWKDTDEPTADTLTAKFKAKAGEPLDDDEKKKQILKLTQLFRKAKKHIVTFDGQDCVLAFRAVKHQLQFLTPGRDKTYVGSSAKWPDLEFSTKGIQPLAVRCPGATITPMQ